MKPMLISIAACLLMAASAPNGKAESPKDSPAPLPSTSEEVELTNVKAGIKLAGTLMIPRSAGPHAAIVLVSGSGPYVRENNINGQGYFTRLADRLLREGVAVLHYDKRGCGKSEGDKDLLQSTMSDFADDVLAGVEYLKGRREIDPKRIGLYGHSEGSSVVPLAASRSADVAFIVLTGASVLSADKIILSQVERRRGHGSSFIRILRGAGGRRDEHVVQAGQYLHCRICMAFQRLPHGAGVELFQHQEVFVAVHHIDFHLASNSVTSIITAHTSDNRSSTWATDGQRV